MIETTELDIVGELYFFKTTSQRNLPKVGKIVIITIANFWREKMQKTYKKVLSANIELYIPKTDDLWFRRDCMADPKTMSYNAGYDVGYKGYHYDTGCIDFAEKDWANWSANKLLDPNFFYAYIVDKTAGEFVGYVNFNKDAKSSIATIGIVIKDEFRGRGYMRPALKKLFEEGRKQGVKKFTDTVPENRVNALKVFYDLGFEKTNEFCTNKFGNQEIVAEISKEL